MVEVDYTANVAEAAVEYATTIIETIVEAVEDMAAAAEAITKEDLVHVAIMIMATIAT